MTAWQKMPNKLLYRNQCHMNARHGLMLTDCFNDVVTHPIIIACVLLYPRRCAVVIAVMVQSERHDV